MSKYQAWKSFEQEIVRVFKKMGWTGVKRNWDTQFEEKSGRDLLNTEPYCVQIKYGINPNPVGGWREANSEKKKGEIPVCISRYKEDKNTLVVLSWKDFQWLISK